MKIDFDKIIIIILFIVIGLMGVYTFKINRHTEEVITEIEHFEENGKYTQIYYGQEIIALKQENKKLYDSLKYQKDKIEFLTQFNYTKKYTTDTVYIEKHDTINNDITPNIFTYHNEPNDTLKYELKIGSAIEPNWYKLDFEISDKFTIVNKKVGENVSETNIESTNGGQISDVTMFSKKEKKNIWNKIAIGPSVSFGYDPLNNNCELMIGVSVTYNLFGD